MRGGCARSTPLSMPQLLLIPTATTTVESSATITIMPSSTLGFACAVQRLAHHRALVQGEDELGRKCSRERLGVDSPYAYPGNPHSGARAVVMSLTSCHGQVARTRAPEASARVCQLFVAPPVYTGTGLIPIRRSPSSDPETQTAIQDSSVHARFGVSCRGCVGYRT